MSLNLRGHLIERKGFLDQISFIFEVNQVCALLGPRQAGKTTLALQFAKQSQDPVHHFDLENPRDLAPLIDNPMLCLESLIGLVILDEIQRVPELFPVLRYLVDYKPIKFLILGSASRQVIQQSSESLAGRISTIELTPLQLMEVEDQDRHWQFGGYPKAFFARSYEMAHRWLGSYIATFVEHDLAMIGLTVDPYKMRQLWSMLAHYHGGVINFSDLGRSLAMSSPHVKTYVEHLHNTFMIRLLRPWHENISKRQVKSPKVYIRDSGICFHLLDISKNSKEKHPKLGALWEGYALEEIVKSYELAFLCKDTFYFWKTESGAEIDLILMDQGRRIGFEIKYSDTPKITPSMKIALHDLKLKMIFVVLPVCQRRVVNEHIQAISLIELLLIIKKRLILNQERTEI